MKSLVDIEILKKIALEYSIKGPTILAEEIGVSKQRVHQLVNQLRKKGVRIDRPKHYTINFKKALVELKKDYPELFKGKGGENK